MARLKNLKLEASTLMEVLVALIIVVAIFGISLVVFRNISYSGITPQKVAIQNELDAMIKTVGDRGAIDEELITLDDVEYHFFSRPSSCCELLEIEIKAIKNGQLISSVKRYIKPKYDIEEN